MKYYIGVDVGGTTTTVSLGDESRTVLRISDQFPTRSEEGPHATIASIRENSLLILRDAGVNREQVTHIGLATPGPATLEGVLLKTPNLRSEQWNQFPIRLELEKAFQELLPVVAVRYIGDGQAAAFGEFVVRTGMLAWPTGPQLEPNSSLRSLFMVTVGTGLGGGEVRDGKVVRGIEGRAGHAGHLLLPNLAFRYEQDRQLMVGNAPCTVESAVSLTALTHQLGHRLSLEQWKDHPLNTSPGSIRDKAKRLRDLASQGDPLALELFDDQAAALGIGLLNVNYVGDYDLLVIGGGVCDLSPELRERYRQHALRTYRQYSLDGFRHHLDIEFSVCGDNSSVLGALAHAFD